MNDLSQYIIKAERIPNIVFRNSTVNKEIVRIDATGRIFWLEREVTTDEEFRQAMLELHKALTK